MTLTDSKIEANQANAQHSTGPRTEQGKAASSRNALRHGLTSMTVLLPGEDPAQYQALYDGMSADLNPFNTTETALVQELIDVQWRLRRVPRLEAQALSADPPDFKSLNGMSLCASRLKRQFSTTLKEFQQMHSANMEIRAHLLDQAQTIHQADLACARPSTLPTFGFDFSVEFVEQTLVELAALEEARQIVRAYQNQQDEDELSYMDDAA